MRQEEWTVEAADAYLNEIPKFTSEKHTAEGLRRMLSYLNALPQEERIVHVAGTNGKGSVCSFLDAVLQKAGKRTARFTSPHLVRVTERFSFDGQEADDALFLEAFEAVKASYAHFEQEGLGHPTYFEYLFLMFMWMVRRKKPEYVILETGLGGRLDATNAVDNPVVSVITTISLEHTAILGDTIEKIANEKAGIIKPGIPVVCSGIVKEAADVIRKRAADFGCDCHVVDDNTFELIQNTYGYIDFLIHNEYYKNDCFRLSTNALYQMENASIALTVCANLCDRGMIKLDNKAVSMAMYDTHWAGRMELLRDNLYVDGAHNPQGIQSFVDSVNSLYENSRLDKATLLFSVVSDKNYDRMIKILCSCKHFRQIYVTITGGIRKLPADIIKETFEAHIKDTPVYVFESVEEAMKKWDNRLMFATGSLYLVGDVDRALEGKENNHD